MKERHLPNPSESSASLGTAGAASSSGSALALESRTEKTTSVVCATCKKVQVQPFKWIQQVVPVDHTISHGLCPDCCARYRATLNTLRPAQSIYAVAEDLSILRAELKLELQRIVNDQRERGLPDLPAIKDAITKLTNEAGDLHESIVHIHIALSFLRHT